MTRILLVDDHIAVRKGLQTMIESRPGWSVCAETGNGRTAVKLATELKPDIAIVDLELPDLNGLETTRQIKRAIAETEVLIYTMYETEELMRKALAAGARGYAVKADAGQSLMDAVEALSRHKTFLPSAVSDTVLENFVKTVKQEESDYSILTTREREIVQLLAEAKGNKEIATALCISVKTVETHRAAIMRKLRIKSIVELVHYAIRNRLVSSTVRIPSIE
jgi:DNA-binding NarL/FixJ family response regulator